MNNSGTHVGRPAYTPEQRLEVSTQQFLRGLQIDEETGHWHHAQPEFTTADGKRVRKAKFSMMVRYPDVTFGKEDRVYVSCPDKNCVNPKHLRVKSKPDGPLHELHEPELIHRVKAATTILAKKHALYQLKNFWQAHPITEDHEDAAMRLDLIPDDEIPDDIEGLRVVALEYGITAT